MVLDHDLNSVTGFQTAVAVTVRSQELQTNHCDLTSEVSVDLNCVAGLDTAIAVGIAHDHDIVGCRNLMAGNTFGCQCDLGGCTHQSITCKAGYNDFRLEQTVDGKPCFILDNGVIKESGEADELHYYKNIYAEYIDKYCQGYLIKSVPHYYDLTKYLATVLIVCEIAPSYLLAGIIIYLLPTFIFRRGRMTFGKAMYHISLVNNKLLNPKISISLLRFTIFYFGELILSLFTFGIPYIISFSMMVFTKKKQGFPDYMLDLQEVDTSKNKVFYTLEEIKLDQINPSKKPVDFNVPIRR